MIPQAHNLSINPVRTERRFGVTSQLKPIQRQHLLALISSEVWDDLLDVMEMQCIEIETELINTPQDEPEKVLANHKYAKAAWIIFTRLQSKIREESQVFLRNDLTQPETLPIPKEDAWRDHLLDALKPAPEDAEYFGI